MKHLLLSMLVIICSLALSATSSAPATDVFDPMYRLLPLADVENYVKYYRKLPNWPTADLTIIDPNSAEIQKKLLEKVEELTLYVIQLKKDNMELNKKIDLLQQQVLNAQINQIQQIRNTGYGVFQ
ncbi:MAG: hypothetical protein PHV30_09485 [Candidatus Margulisbacteria bacterium]|nr:hypothetical protein [Candidatus Margulisiibacteriota bacterium]